jgi:hypothetical protein
MAVNAAKIKYIVFRTQGKPVNPLDCNLVLNDNEIGVKNNPDLIHQIERIHNNGGTKRLKLLGVLFMSIFHLMNILYICVQKYPNPYFV